MVRLTLTAKRPGYVPKSPRAAQLMRCFGLDRLDLDTYSRTLSISLDVGPGQICLLTGPSGTGKTLLMRQIFQQIDEPLRLWLDDVVLQSDRCVIDCVNGTIEEAIRHLSKVGLTDVFTMLRPPAYLSTGQQFRFRLLQALESGRKCLFVDEFGSSLDPPGAAILAIQTAHLVRQNQMILFAASAREEWIGFLEPDILLRLDWAGQAEVLTFQPDTKTDKLDLGKKGMPPDDPKVKQAAIRRRGLKS